MRIKRTQPLEYEKTAPYLKYGGLYMSNIAAN